MADNGSQDALRGPSSKQCIPVLHRSQHDLLVVLALRLLHMQKTVREWSTIMGRRHLPRLPRLVRIDMDNQRKQRKIFMGNVRIIPHMEI